MTGGIIALITLGSLCGAATVIAIGITCYVCIPAEMASCDLRASNIEVHGGTGGSYQADDYYEGNHSVNSASSHNDDSCFPCTEPARANTGEANPHLGRMSI